MDFELQSIVGRKVHDVDGKVAGRIGQVMATRIGADCRIDEYHLGPAAFLSRLGIRTGHLIGLRSRRGPLRVPWHQMDLSDPHHPRLKCRVEELR